MTNLGTYLSNISKKYENIPCRIRPIKNSETISDGKEKEKPSNYRIYIADQINILPTDLILIGSKFYDVLYNNKCYGHHLQVDTKWIEISESSFNGFITEDSKFLFISEGGSIFIME
jgi:hypothetical protein